MKRIGDQKRTRIGVWVAAILAVLLLAAPAASQASGAGLMAGIAKEEITDRAAGPVNDPSYAKALVLKSGSTAVVIITVDAVAIGELGRIGDGFLASVRAQLQKDPGIPPTHVFASASHCHSVVRTDSDVLAVRAVRQAWASMVPVNAGAGRGREDRIMENRRLKMKDGSEVDIRQAYSMPPDEDVAGIGPVDPEIGLLRLDRKDGKPLAVIYNFAAHPIKGVPGGGNTADIPGFASKAIEESLGGGALAFFLQGCAGDINPAKYKDVHEPHDAEPLGNLLGFSVLRALRAIETRDGATLRVIHEVVQLPRGTDLERRMAAIQSEQQRLLSSLQGATLDLKSFLALYVQYKLSGDFPSYYSHRYMHEKALSQEGLSRLDADNRANMEKYIRNIRTIEQLTRLQTNLALLRMHHARNVAAGTKTIDAEVAGARIGDFVLVTFPGELSVEIGIGIKKRAPGPFTFVAGCTNGYLYYTPTAEQRNNSGYAQEDCDSEVGPEWQRIFEQRVEEILKRL